MIFYKSMNWILKESRKKRADVSAEKNETDVTMECARSGVEKELKMKDCVVKSGRSGVFYQYFKRIFDYD